jgi:hypothetical protein
MDNLPALLIVLLLQKPGHVLLYLAISDQLLLTGFPLDLIVGKYLRQVPVHLTVYPVLLCLVTFTPPRSTIFTLNITQGIDKMDDTRVIQQIRPDYYWSELYPWI